MADLSSGTARRHDPGPGHRHLRRSACVLAVAGLLAGAGALGTSSAQATPPLAPTIKVGYHTAGLVPAPGGDVQAGLQVVNTGQAPVTITNLISDLRGDLVGQGSCVAGTLVQPGDDYTCEFPTSFKGKDGAVRVDTITAMVTDGATSGQDSASSVTTIGSFRGNIGFVSLCVRADNRAGQVTGTYDMDLLGGSIPIPVGTCTIPVPLPAGDLTVLQEDLPGQRTSNCLSSPIVRLRRCDPTHSRAVVHVAQATAPSVTAGSRASLLPAHVAVVPAESQPDLNVTQLTMVVRAKSVPTTGSLTVCAAVDGLPAGTAIDVTVGTRPLSIPTVAQTQLGLENYFAYCKTLNGFALGEPVTITQTPVNDVYLQGAFVYPQDRAVSSDPSSQSVVVTPGTGRTYVALHSSFDPCGIPRPGLLGAAVTSC